MARERVLVGIVMRERYFLYHTIALLTFAIGCLTKFFGDLNQRNELSPEACMRAYPALDQHLLVGLAALFISLWCLLLFSRRL
jgi:hypothetical protein